VGLGPVWNGLHTGHAMHSTGPVGSSSLNSAPSLLCSPRDRELELATEIDMKNQSPSLRIQVHVCSCGLCDKSCGAPGAAM